MPGIDDDMDGAMQQAAQPIRHVICLSIVRECLSSLMKRFMIVNRVVQNHSRCIAQINTFVDMASISR